MAKTSQSSTSQPPESMGERFERYAEFFFQTKKIWLSLLIPVVCLALAFWGWKTWEASQAEGRRAALARIDQNAQKVLEDHGEAIKALRAEIADLGDASKGPAHSKKQELEGQVEALKPDTSTVVGEYKDFFQTYRHSPEGRAAALRAVLLVLENDSHSEAVELLGEVLAQDESKGLGEFYGVQVRVMYAGLLEELGRHEDALTEIERVLQEFPPAYNGIKPQVYYTQARLGFALQRAEVMRQAADQLLREFPRAPETQLVLGLSLLE